jgi:DNA-binding response OmpR family regulator
MNGFRILLVDDESDILALLEEYLGAQGFEVESAGTGWEAIEKAEKGASPFDAALVDWSIPGIQGADVVQQLHQLQPDCLVFAMTGHPAATVIGSQAGPLLAGVFRKPFSLRELLQGLNQKLSGRKPRTAPKNSHA